MLGIVWTHRNQHALDQLDTLILERPHRHEAIVLITAQRTSRLWGEQLNVEHVRVV
jgi:hypothetical protein